MHLILGKDKQLLRALSIHMVVGFFPTCQSLPQRPSWSKYISGCLVPEKYRRDIKRCCIRKSQIFPSDCGDSARTRVFVLSDLHTDYLENMAWLKCLSTVRCEKDVLLVAGDVAETRKNFVSTVYLLKDRFEHVFYVPGNHDLWCRREGETHLDSLGKLNKLLDACGGLGIQTGPRIIDGLGIIPLYSWYHESFDKEKDIHYIRIPSLEMACKDFHGCKWPRKLSSKDFSHAVYFDAMNEKNSIQITEIQQTCGHIITFSHFLPRPNI